MYVTNWNSNNVTVINGTRIVASIDVGDSPFNGVEDTVTGQTYITDYVSDNVTVIGTNLSAYSVSFNETGLPGGTEWGAGLGATTVFDTNSSITFSSPNGTFNYSIRPIAGFEVNDTGRVTVAGNSTVVNVTFREVFGVRFFESGLPSGAIWNVTVSGIAVNFTAPWANFTEPNGSYRVLDLADPRFLDHVEREHHGDRSPRERDGRVHRGHLPANLLGAGPSGRDDLDRPGRIDAARPPPPRRSPFRSRTGRTSTTSFRSRGTRRLPRDRMT